MSADRRLPLIYAIIFVDVVVGSIVGPVMPDFVRGLPRPQLWLALGTALFLGVQLFSAPVLGKLSDVYGRQPVFVVSAIGTFLANCLLLPVRSGFYLANRLSDGLTNGMYATVRAAITDISRPADLFKNLGIEGAIVSLAFVIGPAVSGAVLTLGQVPSGQQAATVVMLAVGLSALNIGLSLLLGETHRGAGPSGLSNRIAGPSAIRAEVRESLDVSQLWNRLIEKDRLAPGIKSLVLMQLALTLATGYYFYFVSYVSLGPLRMDAKAISYLFMYFGGLSVAISYGFFTFLADRINQPRAILWFAGLGVPILGGYALVGQSVPALYALTTLDTLTFSLAGGLIEGLLARHTTDADRGEIFGINQALQGVASFGTTLVFGVLSVIDLRLPFAWFAACLAALAWLAWQRYRTVE
jgi:MFS transporter, DHA1 family, tetracycline resistance protein